MSNPGVCVERIDATKRPVLERLLQFHLFEIGMNPGADGTIDWGEPLDKFFSDASHLPFFLVTEKETAGFALVKLERRPTGPDGKTPFSANLIEEFHILRPFRRRGVGAQAVELIRQLHPGPWMATCWPNEMRVGFWRHVAQARRGTEFLPNEHKGFPGQFVWVF